MNFEFSFNEDKIEENIIKISKNTFLDFNEENFSTFYDFKKNLNQINIVFGYVGSKKGTITLITDFFNNIPIFYFFDSSKLYVSTDLSYLVKNTSYNKKINLSELYLYLDKGESSESQTLWDGIFHVPAGHIIKIANGKEVLNESYLIIDYLKKKNLTFQIQKV